MYDGIQATADSLGACLFLMIIVECMPLMSGSRPRRGLHWYRRGSSSAIIDQSTLCGRRLRPLIRLDARFIIADARLEYNNSGGGVSPVPRTPFSSARRRRLDLGFDPRARSSFWRIITALPSPASTYPHNAPSAFHSHARSFVNLGVMTGRRKSRRCRIAPSSPSGLGDVSAICDLDIRLVRARSFLVLWGCDGDDAFAAGGSPSLVRGKSYSFPPPLRRHPHCRCFTPRMSVYRYSLQAEECASSALCLCLWGL
ncbi:hypothetical protein C8R46DRAFT_673382 [Mycena filopes]|nr:hypothetical protein C8R46DRAFT_673382 [Mycena filopes]